LSQPVENGADVQPEHLRFKKLSQLICGFAPTSWINSKQLYSLQSGVAIANDSDLEAAANTLMQESAGQPVLRLSFQEPGLQPSLAQRGTKLRRLPKANPPDLITAETVITQLARTFTRSDMTEQVTQAVYTNIISPRIRFITSARNVAHTYGEFTSEFIRAIMRECKIDKSSLIVDLGSGIGNIVVQAVLETGCRAFGCELDSSRHEAAKTYLDATDAMLKQCSLLKLDFMDLTELELKWKENIVLVNGDIFHDKQTMEYMASADLAFCNNFKFGQELSNSVGGLLRSIPSGAVLVTSAAVVLGRNVAEQLSQLGVQQEVGDHSLGASWTISPMKYWLYRKGAAQDAPSSQYRALR
jgi:precorrin-6B methylase 2